MPSKPSQRYFLIDVLIWIKRFEDNALGDSAECLGGQTPRKCVALRVWTACYEEPGREFVHRVHLVNDFENELMHFMAIAFI